MGFSVSILILYTFTPRDHAQIVSKPEDSTASFWYLWRWHVIFAAAHDSHQDMFKVGEMCNWFLSWFFGFSSIHGASGGICSCGWWNPRPMPESYLVVLKLCRSRRAISCFGLIFSERIIRHHAWGIPSFAPGDPEVSKLVSYLVCYSGDVPNSAFNLCQKWQRGIKCIPKAWTVDSLTASMMKMPWNGQRLLPADAVVAH